MAGVFPASVYLGSFPIAHDAVLASGASAPGAGAEIVVWVHMLPVTVSICSFELLLYCQSARVGQALFVGMLTPPLLVVDAGAAHECFVRVKKIYLAANATLVAEEILKWCTDNTSDVSQKLFDFCSERLPTIVPAENTKNQKKDR